MTAHLLLSRRVVGKTLAPRRLDARMGIDYFSHITSVVLWKPTDPTILGNIGVAEEIRIATVSPRRA
jgi:hypothetical protein